MMNKQKTAVVSGATGQVGSYLVELLLSKGYKVIGLKRRTSLICTDRVDHLYDNPDFQMEYFDLHDPSSIWNIFIKYQPDEIYNLACMSHVRVSFDVPEETVKGIVLGTLTMLNAMKAVCPNARFYQASSSEMFGDTTDKPPFNENSRMMPASPYSAAKLCAHHLIRNYRESYNLHCTSGIVFNTESPRRGETFVTRKITLAAARIKLGLQKTLELGNLEALRDWSYAPEAANAMYLMLQQDTPDDYVIATGETHSVREFLQEVFEYAGLGDPMQYVQINEKYLRPHEVPLLLGDYSKAKKKLGWEPKIKFKELARIMYDEDMAQLLDRIHIDKDGALIKEGKEKELYPQYVVDDIDFEYCGHFGLIDSFIEEEE